MPFRMVRLMNQRRIKNPVKHLRGSIFFKKKFTTTSRKLLSQKSSILDRFKYAYVNITLNLRFLEEHSLQKVVEFLRFYQRKITSEVCVYKSCNSPKGLQLYYKETLTQVISCEYSKSFEDSFFTEQLWWLLLN